MGYYADYLSDKDWTIPDSYEEPEEPDNGNLYDDGDGPGDPYDFPPEPTIDPHDPEDPITSTGHFNPQVDAWGKTVYYAWLGTCERGTSNYQIWIAQTDDEGKNWIVRQITWGHGKSNLCFRIDKHIGTMHFMWHQKHYDDGYAQRRGGGAVYTAVAEIDEEEGILSDNLDQENMNITQRTNFPDSERIREGGYNFHGTYGIRTFDVEYGICMYAGSGLPRDARSLLYQDNIVALNGYCSFNDTWCLAGTGFHIGGDFLGGPDKFAWRTNAWPGWGIWHCVTPREPKAMTVWGGFTYPAGICFGSLRTTNLDYKSHVSVNMCFGMAYYSWRARAYDGSVGPGRIVTAKMDAGDWFTKWHITDDFSGVNSDVKCVDQGVYCPDGGIRCNDKLV